MDKIIGSAEELINIAKDSGLDFPYSADTSVLNTPFCFPKKTAPNRIVYQAMEGCDGTAAGSPRELTVRRYKRFAEGAPGIIWFEATAVCHEGRANPRQLYLHSGNINDFKQLVRLIKETSLKKHGFAPLIFIQLTHSGRYSRPEGKPAPLIAGNNPLLEKEPLPDSCIVTDAYLDTLASKFAASAALSEAAGFDGADIKSCHGYLFNELLASHTRKGKYGGEYNSRTRLIKDIAAAVKNAVSDNFMLTTRINAYDGFAYPYGFGSAKDNPAEPDYSEIKQLSGELNLLGMPLINITMGNPYVNPHVNRPFASGGYAAPENPLTGVHRMLKGVSLIKSNKPSPAFVCSALTYLGAVSPFVAAGGIKEGWFDFAGFGRMTLAYPDVAADILKGTFDKRKICTACSNCSRIMRAGGTPGCVVRDGVYTEIFKKMRSDKLI